MDNLSFLVEAVKKENGLKGCMTLLNLDAIIPPKDPKDAKKLTVCVEMDDVFLFVFSPDELEGYLY